MLEQKLPYRIAFCPEAVCWTQAPDSLRILSSQRKRWGRGNLKNMVDYRQMHFNPRYKQIGLFTMPYNVLFETLNPYFKATGLLSLIGYVMMDMTHYHILLVFFLINFLFGYLLTIGSFLLEEIAFRRYPKVQDFLKMIAYSAFMFCGYYQIGAIWRFLGHIDYLRNNNNWGVMTRQSWQVETTKSQTT
jgi:cellulose synthase/poly-beta-1,6-N-acetylglucosamine synthase-like glycosyltransferase